MSASTVLADRFVAALAARDAAAIGPLLADDAAFVRLGARTDGRDAVRALLLDTPQYARLSWRPSVAGEAGVIVHGLPGDASRETGLVLTLTIDGATVRRIEQQRTPPVPPPWAPVRLTPALIALIDGALVARRPMLVAYVDEDGQPVLSFRGSVQVHDPERLGMWVRNAEGRMIASIARNPRVALMYRDEDTKATYQFQGRARVVDDPALREAIYARAPLAERHHDFARVGRAVLIELDRVEGYAGLGPAGQIDRILMRRD